ncbi:hypothetical protein F4806DRAFT_446242 [Annulohypoxylon nitens]|nr:hypothetical protein F4806DRAFT_446242 [Annulohypoxylon nitens]
MVPAPTPQSSAAASAPGDSNTTKDSSNEYTEALDKLEPLQPVLQGFNHRNRAQHRHATWWASFGMLRRHLDRLIESLHDSSAAYSTSGGKKRKRGDDGNGNGYDRAERKTRDHVKWVRDILVPKCYFAFSQLTADNQFAILGVVLLGALAQLNACCVQLIGEVVIVDVEEKSSTLPARELTDNSKESTSSNDKNLPPERPAQKGGAVVSRDEVARAEKLRKKNALLKDGVQAESPDVSGGTGKDTGRDDGARATPSEKPRSATSKSKTKEIDGSSSKEGLKPAKKKKKTKKGGDEFDNLFKGLF